MRNLNEPIRVLQIVSKMDRGGAETLLMNIYRNIDRSMIQFDFITHSSEKGDFDAEIRSLGGEICQIPSLGEVGLLRYIKALKMIMKRKQYAAIHVHTDFQGGFPALAAKQCGISRRICHSHSSNWPRGNQLMARYVLFFLQTLIKLTATSYCSCSLEAANFLFGKKLVKKGQVDILKNGIDLLPFLAEESNRLSVITELKLPADAKIIGHVGRFSESKNHIFFLHVFKRLILEDPISTYVVLFIGAGPLMEQVRGEAKKLGIDKHIRFLGVRTDIARLMKAFDVFLFPSLFEGFGIAVLEAQCAATPCVVSDVVPTVTDMGLNLVTYLELDADLQKWSDGIRQALTVKRPDQQLILSKIIQNGFSIQENIANWLALYGLPNEGSAQAAVTLA